MARVADNRQGIIERTAEAREAAELTQEEVATVLGIKQGRYKHYETRTPLPHKFIPAFCLVVRCNPVWFVTGQGQMHAPMPSQAGGTGPKARRT